MAWLFVALSSAAASAFLTSGLTITNSAEMLLNAAAMAIWLIRRTPVAARLVERKVRSALLTEVATLRDHGLFPGGEIWVHSVGDAFVIVHYQGEHELDNALFWDPKRKSFVPFVQLDRIPEVGNRYWRLAAANFHAIRYRTLADYVTQRD